MRVVIAYCDKDEEMVFKLAGWMRDLGPYPGHSIFVARDISSKIRPFVNIGFDKYDEIEISDDVWRHWPESCNNAFGHAARHVENVLDAHLAEPQPWLWLEPDVVPLRPGWLNSIAREYATMGTPFLGDFVSVHTPELDVPDHMSGIAVYPGSMTNNAGMAIISQEIAWDVAAAYQIVPRMATSKFILHNWKHPPFPDMEAVQKEIYAKKPECVLFHADKSGTLIDLLRDKHAGMVNGAQGDPATGALPSRSAGPQPIETTMPACDILIKSYPPDFDRLKYCLRSIDRFTKGFRKIVLIIPHGEYPRLQSALAGIPWLDFNSPIEVVEHGEGYLYQQAVKACAHEYSDAEYILHIDSDTMFTRPVTPLTFFNQGKIWWLYTPYEEIVTPWQKITEKFMDEAVDFEFMRRLPLLMPRWLHVDLAKFCLKQHRMRLFDYIMAQPSRGFSEFNALGALAFTRHKERFIWINTTKEPMPNTVAIQRWTGDPFDDVVKAKCEDILCGGVEHPVVLPNGVAEPAFNGECYVADGMPPDPNPILSAGQQRAAHMRAVMAAKRATGWKPKPRGRGKKKRKMART